jgi:hypothetical protein
MHRKYYDLGATLYVMRTLVQEGAVDGFEFELLAEWNPDWPPIDKDTRFDRRFEWENSRKYDVSRLATLIEKAEVPVFSIHANRDIGMLLCSGQPELVDRGRTLIEQALALARRVKARVCVFHLWDAWTTNVDFAGLHRLIDDETSAFPGIKIAVENIPTYDTSLTPFSVVRDFPWITLDLKWATLYHEFERFQDVRQKIANIHFHGNLRGGRWVLNEMDRDCPAVYREVVQDWDYRDLITLEAEEDFSDLLWNELISGISSVREQAG